MLGEIKRKRETKVGHENVLDENIRKIRFEQKKLLLLLLYTAILPLYYPFLRGFLLHPPSGCTVFKYFEPPPPTLCRVAS